MIEFVLEVLPKVGHYERALSLMKKNIPLAMVEEGCLNYEIIILEKFDDRFYLLEKWSDQTTLDKHKQQEYLKQFRNEINDLLHSPYKQLSIDVFNELKK